MPKYINLLLPAAMVVALGCTVDAAAQTSRQTEDDRGVFGITLENDFVADTDEQYTNGFRMSWFSPESNVPALLKRAADATPFFGAGGNTRYGFAIGQSMFTPENTDASVPDPDDRPYAGWLYGSAGLIEVNDDELDSLLLTVGIVGPSALAAETQHEIHHWRGFNSPQGWDYQLRDEPGVLVTYEHKWRNLYSFTPFGWGADITPHAGGALGNVFTYANAGLTVRFGYDLPSDYGPPRIQPSLPGSDYFKPTRRIGWYVFGAVDGRAVGRNIFLDGNTFRDSPSVDKNFLVGDFQGGVALTLGRARLAYTQVFRTREFETQDDNTSFGGFTLSFRF